VAESRHDFISRLIWRSSSPRLSLVGCEVSAMLQQRICHNRIQDSDNMKWVVLKNRANMTWTPLTACTYLFMRQLNHTIRGC